MVSRLYLRSASSWGDRLIARSAKGFYSKLLAARATIRIFREALLEASYYASWAGLIESSRGASSHTSEDNRVAELMKNTHRVEKGLSISDTKRPFGKRVASDIEVALAESPKISSSIKEPAEDVLEALEQWNQHGLKDARIAQPYHNNIREQYECSPEFADFLSQRRSIRNFDRNQEVNDSVVAAATQIARNAPSVCNRQSGRLHLFRGEKLAALLDLQNGNSTFRESVTTLLVITVESQYFLGPYELRQLGIDGGIFALQTSLALASLGVGSCFLNWDMPEKETRDLRKVGDIPVSEYVVCLMAIGYPSQSALVARSARRSVDEILRIH